MKRQFYFDDVERDLLRCALGFWKSQLDDQRESHPGAAHYRAKKFTLRRIEAMEARLQEPIAGPSTKSDQQMMNPNQGISA